MPSLFSSTYKNNYSRQSDTHTIKKAYYDIFDDNDFTSNNNNYLDHEVEEDDLTRTLSKLSAQERQLVSDLEFFEKKNVELLQSTGFTEITQLHKPTLSKRVKHFFSKLGSLFQSPKYYLEGVIAQTTPQLMKHSRELSQMLLLAQRAQLNETEALKLNKLICQESMAIIQHWISLNNLVRWEVSYCEHWAGVFDRVISALGMGFANRQGSINFPNDINMGISERYRMSLYHITQGIFKKLGQVMMTTESVIQPSKDHFASNRRKPNPNHSIKHFNADTKHEQSRHHQSAARPRPKQHKRAYKTSHPFFKPKKISREDTLKDNNAVETRTPAYFMP